MIIKSRLNNTDDIKIDNFVFNNNEIENIYVVIGCLDTIRGLIYAQELLKWCSKLYKYIFIVHQKAPGILFEYPALKYCENLAKNSDKHILYLHSKGASYPEDYIYNHHHAKYTRLLWKYCFYVNFKNYIADNLTDDLMVIAPFITIHKKNAFENNVTWLNGFLMTNKVWRNMNIQPDTGRYKYEGILNYYYLGDKKEVTKKWLIDDTVPEFNVCEFMRNKYNIDLDKYIGY